MNNKYELFKKEISGKNVGVVGIGISNIPLIKMLAENGSVVTARDQKTKAELGSIAEELEASGVRLVAGDDYLQNINEQYLFKTPGLRFDISELNTARDNGCVVTSEMELFFDLCPSKIIAVTGSDGKTTTTTLIYEMLRRQGFNCYLGGNIGTPLIDKVGDMKKDDYVVLELSSFQLQTISGSPDIAVVTNVTPNHLDYHKSMEEYIEAKENIFRHQKQDGRLVLNYDNGITRDFSKKASNVVFFSRSDNGIEGFVLKDDMICKNGEEILNIKDIRLPGIHNVENYMAAIAAVWGLVSKETIVSVAREFGGVQHRIEFVKEADGVRYYNDSIASSPTRARAGLYSFKQKLILIAGGYDKNIPFDDFGYDIVERVKILILMGKTAGKIKGAVTGASTFKGEPLIYEVNDLEEAVAAAKNSANAGDVVILSPACASFDMFKNFEQRGNAFKELVMQL